MTKTQLFTRTLAVLVAAAALVTTAPTGVPGAPAAAQAVVGDCTPGTDWGTPRPDFATRVVDLVNQHRASRGLSQLSVATAPTNSAVWKARHMARYLYMTHDDPAPPVARTTVQRMEACGVTGGWGENIAYGYASPEAVMQGWLNSPGHRANIENASYRTIGVGAATSSTGRVYWAQAFSTQAGTTPPPPPPPAPACSNGKDDDGDAKVDYPADPGCTSSADTDEYNAAAPPPPPPPPPPPSTLIAVPNGATINQGTYIGGGVAGITADDDVFLRIGSSSGSVLWWGRFTGVPNSITSLKTTYRGFSSVPCTQTLYAWNWSLGYWASLGSTSLGTTESATTATVTGSLADYVSGSTGNGDVAVRVGCSAGSFASFTLSSDLLYIAYTP
jgi:uncharacterized protein YkwD